MKLLSKLFARKEPNVDPYWSRFNHAYGSASDLPELFAAMTPDPNASVWRELGSRLCHQGGSVTVASYAALPVLINYAESLRPEEREAPLVLAGSIVALEEHASIPAELQSDYETKIAAAHELAVATLECQESTAGFTTVLSSLAAFERHHTLARELLAFADEQIELACPRCDVGLILTSSGNEWLWLGEEREEVSLRPVAGTGGDARRFGGERFEQLARAHKQEAVAEWLAKLSMAVACPACEKDFILIEGIAYSHSTAA